jgi:hypothetical protein
MQKNEISIWKPVHQRASTVKSNKSTAFGNQYIKEHQQESQINQRPLETRLLIYLVFLLMLFDILVSKGS